MRYSVVNAAMTLVWVRFDDYRKCFTYVLIAKLMHAVVMLPTNTLHRSIHINSAISCANHIPWLLHLRKYDACRHLVVRLTDS